MQSTINASACALVLTRCRVRDLMDSIEAILSITIVESGDTIKRPHIALEHKHAAVVHAQKEPARSHLLVDPSVDKQSRRHGSIIECVFSVANDKLLFLSLGMV